jgi:hypothetical protein
LATTLAGTPCDVILSNVAWLNKYICGALLCALTTMRIDSRLGDTACRRCRTGELPTLHFRFVNVEMYIAEPLAELRGELSPCELPQMPLNAIGVNRPCTLGPPKSPIIIVMPQISLPFCCIGSRSTSLGGEPVLSAATWPPTSGSLAIELSSAVVTWQLSRLKMLLPLGSQYSSIFSALSVSWL